MQVKRVRGSGPGRPARARRTLIHYVATCRECEELPKSPREAHVHSVDAKHTLTETKHYVVEPPE